MSRRKDDFSKTTDFPLGSVYGTQDGAETRKVFFKACKNQPGVFKKRRKIVTSLEWRQLEKGGADLSKYVTLEQIQYDLRQKEIAQQKERNAAAQIQRQHDSSL